MIELLGLAGHHHVHDTAFADKCPYYNYRETCPDGWKLDENSVCRAPPTYVGNCPNNFDFRGHSVEFKDRFAKYCDVRWPCLPEKPWPSYSQLSLPSYAYAKAHDPRYASPAARFPSGLDRPTSDFL